MERVFTFGALSPYNAIVISPKFVVITTPVGSGPAGEAGAELADGDVGEVLSPESDLPNSFLKKFMMMAVDC